MKLRPVSPRARALVAAVVLSTSFAAAPLVAAQETLPDLPSSKKEADARRAELAASADPAFVAMLGSSVRREYIPLLSAILRAATVPGAAPSADLPVFAVLKSTGTPEAPKFEGSALTLDLLFDRYPSLRIENARLVLMPSADGHSCRFEASGSPFGATSKLEATGSIEWGTGPAGGNKLDVEFRLDDAPVEAVRTWIPNRVDPSFGGMLDVHGKASGVVGETTTEDMPATPLKGELEATLDWSALGRTGPFQISTQFARDDKIIRLKDGRLAWQGETLGLKGWVNAALDGDFDLSAPFTNVDTQKVAERWNVAPQWRPSATLSGAITLKGKPGAGMLRYEAKAPLITVPLLGGWDARIENAGLIGSLVAINADIACSIRSDRIVIGGIDLGPLPVGIRWWEHELHVNNSNTKLWNGENDGGLVWEPSKHPAFRFNGRIKNADAPALVNNLIPGIGFDVDGVASVAALLGQDKERVPQVDFHGSMTQGRIGGSDLFGDLLAALGKADPALQIDDVATFVKAPNKGKGTRIDRLFFEAHRAGETVELGGLFLKSSDFQLDADGEFTRAGGVKLDGSVSLPAPVTEKLVASAPWLKALLQGGTTLFVPVAITGQPAALRLSLAPGFPELLAKAKAGETVTAPSIKEARHVGESGISIIPVDPANDQLQ